MDPTNHSAMVRLRLLVGYLGEPSQFNWWPSGFFAPSSVAFLTPVFHKTALLAQYHGVQEAARRVHDAHIGIGRVFHLFRLPEPLEHALFEHLQATLSTVDYRSDLATLDTALTALQALGQGASPLQEGPVQLGSVSELMTPHWPAAVARCYHAALLAHVRAFPYFVDRT
ncbi:MAG: BrxE family protein [Candidatus Competibacteraceae bacterium]